MSGSIPVSAALAIALALAACSGQDGASSDTASPPTTTPDNTTTTQRPATTEQSSPPSSVPPSTTTTMPVRLGDNLVFNGDFAIGDEVPAGWQFTVEAEGQRLDYVTGAGDHHISFFAPLVDDVPWPEAGLAQPFDVEPHRDYVLSVEARTIDQGRLFLALVFLDEDGDQILLRGPGEPDISSSDWEEIEGTLESPVGSARALVVLRLAIRPDLSTAESFSVDVSSVSVREILE